MISAYSIAKRPESHVEKPAFSHPVSFRGHREKSDYNTTSSFSNTPRHNRRCLPNLDRQLKDNQGGCLYEWPVVNSLVQEGTGLTVTADQLKMVAPLKHVTDQDYWQKPGIDVAVIKSSPQEGISVREKELITRIVDTVRGKAITMEINRRTT